MSDSKSTASGGIGFAGLLTILFIGLKLGGIGAVAHWSWWWVLSPLWIGAAVGAGLFVLFLVIAAVVAIGAAILGK